MDFNIAHLTNTIAGMVTSHIPFKKGLKKPISQSSVGKFRTVISINPSKNVIHLCNMTVGDPSTFQYETVGYKARLFDEEFFEKFSAILSDYATKFPTEQNAAVTVVVPDMLVSTNVLNLPTMNKNKTEESLRIMLDEIYKNRQDLKINYTSIFQNKQYTTYALAIMRQDILRQIYAACATNKMTPRNVTFCSNAIINAIQAMNTELASKTFVFMNLRAENTYFSLVSKGRTCGFFELPFGYKILQKNRLAAENMLFDSPEAELLVLNAMEKAKVKQLTMMQNDSAAQTAQAINQENEEDGTAADTEEYQSTLDKPTAQTIKVLPKKTPLKLPKFMTRPMPNGEREYAYENFRLFIKWTLNLLQANKATLVDTVETVYVNMPKDFSFLYDMTNKEKEENGVTFAPLPNVVYEADIMTHLELYGGFYDSPSNANNNF